MNDTNKVVLMIENRAKKNAQEKKQNLSKYVFDSIEGTSHYQASKNIFKHIESESINENEVTIVLNAIFDACYERAYKQAYQKEVDNISQILSFMEREVGDE